MKVKQKILMHSPSLLSVQKRSLLYLKIDSWWEKVLLKLMTKKGKTERENEKESGMWMYIYFIVLFYITIQVFFCAIFDFICVCTWACTHMYIRMYIYMHEFKILPLPENKFLISKDPSEAIDKERKNRKSDCKCVYFPLYPYSLRRELTPTSILSIFHISQFYYH